jgi:uncharacterized protein YdbL (DUF1318 family)
MPFSRRNFLALAAGAALLPMFRIAAYAAEDLEEARRQGYVGERPDGYIGLVDPQAPAWAKQLVDKINAERRTRYQDLAASNGTSVEAVQVVAAQKIIEKLPRGAYDMDSGGVWMQK